MFVPAEMSEVDIFVFESDVEAVAQRVADLGVIHLLDANALGEWAEEVSTEWAGRISAYARQERRVLDLLSQLGIPEEVVPCEGALMPAADVGTFEKELQEIEEQTQSLREQHAAVTQEMERWNLAAKSMEVLTPLSISISDLRQLEHLHVVAGTIPAENLARLEASLFRIPFSIIPVYRYQRGVLIFAFCAEEHAAILDRALTSAFLDPLTLPEEFTGTPQEILMQIGQRRSEAKQQLASIEEQRKALAEALHSKLLSMLARIRGDRAISEAMAHFGHRGRVYLIAGWVPKDRVQELREAVEQAAGGRAAFDENSPFTPGTSRKVPTLLRNSQLLRPLEGLVTTYGVPGYREIDPTALLAVTFVVMFGMMFGDLGQGLLLVLVGLALSLRLIPRLSSVSNMGTILIACGASASIFGLLYGSVFGMEEVIPALWLRPMNNIFSLLITTVVFGVVVLNIGFVAHLVTSIREGHLEQAIFDKNGIVGLLLYWTLGAIFVLSVTGRSVWSWLAPMAGLLIALLFFSEPMARLVQRRRPLLEGSVSEFVVQSFFELFEALISYVSNTLSYVRLGAFAVAHVGLSMVVFLLADMLSGGDRSSVVAILIIALGNLVIIGFEGLIVGIQTLRLEDYELFGKFFKGEGVPYKPLTLPGSECQPYQLSSGRSGS